MSDLTLRWCTDSGDVPGTLRRDLTACWRDVVNAGERWGSGRGARSPTRWWVRPSTASSRSWTPERCRLLVAHRDAVLAGWTVLDRNPDPVVGRWPRALRFPVDDVRDEVSCPST